MILLILFFASGALGLIYEVLWLKQLTLVFGNTSYAIATSLAVFFLGLSAGSLFWGKRVIKTPLITYALLELGIGVSAAAYFFIFYFAQGPLVLFFIFLATWFMGGTLPLIAQIFIRSRQEFGQSLGILYAINTLGGVLGAFLGGFYLPVTLGFRLSLFFAILTNFAIALLLFLVSRSKYLSHISIDSIVNLKPQAKFPKMPQVSISNRSMASLVFITGFVTLALEVLWTRMFSQVLLNDVYSFSAILVVFLFAIGCAGFIARHLSSLNIDPMKVASFLLIISGASIGLTPFLFNLFTNFKFIPLSQGWAFYVFQVFTLAFGVIFLPTLVLSALFPYIIQFDQKEKSLGGEILGRWLPLNTFGAILGSLIAGFILITTIGMWWSIALLSGTCLLIGFQKDWVKSAIFISAFSFLPALGRDAIVIDKENGEIVKEVWQGPDGTVSVVSLPANEKGKQEDMHIRLNSYYTLGGLQGLPDERRMAHLPLFLHPNARSVFFLGMGTGITASGALFHPVELVVVSELIPEVVEASRKYFSSYLNGLYEDKRIRIVTEDGRNYLLRTNERYDLIVSDLFYPWNVGSASLYSKEHFTLVRERLEEGGIFVQWLPLHQLSEFEFGVITKTLVNVFPQVTLWRDNFSPDKPLVALVAYTKSTPLDPKILIENVMRLGKNEDELMDFLLSLRGESVFTYSKDLENLRLLLPRLAEITPFTFYVGNITQSREILASYPENTDDKPVIEFLAPKSAGRVRTGEISWLTGKAFEELSFDILNKVPPEEDPYLMKLNEDQKNYVRAGLSLLRFTLATSQDEANYWFNDFLEKTGSDLKI